MPTEKEFAEIFDEEMDSSRSYVEDAIAACKRAGFTFDPEPVTSEQVAYPEQTEASYRDWTAQDHNRLEKLEDATMELVRTVERMDAEAAHQLWGASGSRIDRIEERLTAEEDRVGRLENQVESYKGIIEDLTQRLSKAGAHLAEAAYLMGWDR